MARWLSGELWSLEQDVMARCLVVSFGVWSKTSWHGGLVVSFGARRHGTVA